MRPLKILTANIAMGNPRADHPLEDLYGLIMFHNWRVIPFVLFGNRLRFLFDYSLKPNKRRVPYFKRVSDLSRTLEMIRAEGPDILVLNELLEQFHKEKITAALKEMGFRSFAWGLSSHHPDATLVTLVASRLPALDSGPVLEMPQGQQTGGGGGATCLRLKEQPLTIIGCHLASGIRDLLQAQVRSIVDFAKKERAGGRQVIIAGDFNVSESVVQKVDGFAELGLKSTTDRVTCPVGVPKIFQHPLDHVFLPKDWKVGATKFPAFGSDHLAVSTETETPEKAAP